MEKKVPFVNYGLQYKNLKLRETEEIDWLKKLPGMKCYLPKTNKELRKTVLEAYKTNSPCYIRI